MEELSSQPKPEQQEAPSSAGAPGCLTELGWFLSGSILPMASLSFYRRAAQRRVGMALLFFFAFTMTLALLTSINLGISMAKVNANIQQAFESGRIPQVTIEHGVASANGPQPVILMDRSTPTQSMFIAIDTSGEIRQIDRSRYTQGLLLTRTQLHLLNNNGQYQILPLSELNSTFNKDPIIINATTTSQAWSFFSIIFFILALIFLILWQSLVRLMFLATAALVLWGFVSLLRPNTGYGPIIITGLYATVPAVYFSYLFNRSGIAMPGLQTLLLIIFWGIALIATMAGGAFLSQERPMRLWTAWIGLPMLILFVVDEIIKIPSPYGPIALWSLTFLTCLVLAGLRFYYHTKDMPKPEARV